MEAKPQGSLGRGHGVRKYTETGLFFAEVTMKGYTPKTKCSPARTVTSKVAFEMSFTSDMGAAAAKDVLVRRMWPVRTTSKRVRKTFEGVEKGEPLFKALNFPDASWCELMGLVFACAANESDFAKAKKTVAVAPVTPAAKEKPLVTPVPKKRKTGGAKDRRVKGGERWVRTTRRRTKRQSVSRPIRAHRLRRPYPVRPPRSRPPFCRSRPFPLSRPPSCQPRRRGSQN